MRRLVICAMVLAAAGIGAHAAGKSGTPLTERLPNGLRLVIESNDHTATVVMSALVEVTALQEPRGRRGIRQLTGMLVARGDGSREMLVEAAIRGDMSVAPDYVTLVLGAPVESLEECALAMREMLFNPEFSQRALEPTREELIRRLVAREELPVGLAHRRLFEQIYPGVGSADGGAGDPLELSRITLDDIRRFHSAHYLPNATVIGVSGGVDAREARDALAGAMRGVLPGSSPPAAPEPQSEDTSTSEVAIQGQSSVFATGGKAVALSDRSYPPMAVGMTILGSGMGSRLYRELRLERSIAYTILAELTPAVTAPSGFVLVTCNPEHLDEVQSVVEREIERMMREPVEADELRRAKRYLIGRHAMRRQRNQEVAHYLGVYELLGGVAGYRRGERLRGEIAAVDGIDVADAMRRLFSPSWSLRVDAQ